MTEDLNKQFKPKPILLLGNADLAESCEWQPPGEPERVPFLCDWPKVEAAK